MPKVSVNILTKNRAEMLRCALDSVLGQSFVDYEIVVVNDGSTDNTLEVLKSKFENLNNIKIINHQDSKGITASRQEALESSAGEYVAILDDDDEWVDKDKLKKQVNFLESHKEVVLVGGGIEIDNREKRIEKRSRTETDKKIRMTMLPRNNFFTSTVMFRREAALQAGGFITDEIDLAEDYDLWLRLGKMGKLANFKETFVKYRKPGYNKEKLGQFFAKQIRLINREKAHYPNYWLARTILELRKKIN